MRNLFLFFIITFLTGSPWIALLVILGIYLKAAEKVYRSGWQSQTSAEITPNSFGNWVPVRFVSLNGPAHRSFSAAC